MGPPAMEVHHRAAPCRPRASFSIDRAHHRQVTVLFPPSAALFECPRGPAPPSSSHGRLHPRVTSRTPSSRACAPVAPVQELHEERSSSSSPQEAVAPERSSPRQRCNGNYHYSPWSSAIDRLQRRPTRSGLPSPSPRRYPSRLCPLLPGRAEQLARPLAH
ncbi:uncharacterized protein LOC119288558 [Triticum dicoccoides]|uniref:uncharacterized protein LOC119288558 n=1 Tax=Triticum dicoccoides TaxID=85692 RepID=UPI00188E000C|nr:uncharacterized protein LOC119288558 [Triticum dicoccoides]